MIDRQTLRHTAVKFRRRIESPMSGTLAYTILCMLTLTFALCLGKMPAVVLEHVSNVRAYFG